MLHDRASLPIRLANAAIAYVKYLAMTIWPARLAVYYPYNFHPSPWLAVSAALLLLALTSAAVWCLLQSSRHSDQAALGARACDFGASLVPGACHYKPIAVGWLWYLVTLVPVIGLVQVGSQAMADRYCYIPSIGLFIAFVWAAGATLTRSVSEDAQSWPRSRFGLVSGAAAGSAILAALLVATWGQASYWVNSERLFRHALAITGENPVACENLGDSLLHQKKYAAAEVQFRRVLAMDAERYRQTPPELAQALAGQGRIGDAIAFVHDAIPDNAERAAAMNNLALFLAPKGHVREAIELLQEAIALAADQPLARRNLAWIYATCPNRRFRNGPKAVELARRACELSQWNDTRCRQALADAYLETGDVDRAIEELRAAVRLDPADRAAAEKLQSLLRRK
jgi:Flp pilus assembly protein TadD